MRFVGIRHRVKFAADGNPRPTQIVIAEGKKKPRAYDLRTEDDERDFLLGRFPIKFRDVTEEDKKEDFFERHLKMKKITREEALKIPASLHVFANGQDYIIKKVPEAYTGYQKDDIVLMLLGGSGDNFAYALSRRGEDIGAKVYRMPPAVFKSFVGPNRRDEDKDKDAFSLIELGQEDLSLFQLVEPRDRVLITVREEHKSMIEAMKARLACGQRLRQQVIGKVFCNEEGFYPEGSIEQMFDELKANDIVFNALYKEEMLREKRMIKALKKSDIYLEVFVPIKGCGPRIAARLLSSYIDVRRFLVEPDPMKMKKLYETSRSLEKLGCFEEDRDKVASRVAELGKAGERVNYYRELQLVRSWKRRNGKEDEAAYLDTAIQAHRERARLRRLALEAGMNKFKAYAGIQVVNGRLKRRRRGQVANWNNEARQAYFLIADQFNRQGEKTHWGLRLRHHKAEYRKKHPEPEIYLNDKGQERKRYTNGHIHKMAIWKTISDFAESLFERWVKIEKAHASKLSDDPVLDYGNAELQSLRELDESEVN